MGFKEGLLMRLIGVCLGLLALFSISVSAAIHIMPFQGDALQGGAPINNGNLQVSIYSSIAGGTPLYSDAFANSINNGRFDVVLGNQATDLILNFSQMYYLNFTINGNPVLNQRQPFMNGLARGLFVDSTNQIVKVNGTLLVNGVPVGGGSGVYYNSTPGTYNGNLAGPGGTTGYVAGSAICDAAFSGSHFCTQVEVMNSIGALNISAMPEWSGEAWTSTGSAKYTPAAVPVNDCNGWTHGAAGTYMGNWWHFNTTTGGDGRTGNCANTFPLACCK